MEENRNIEIADEFGAQKPLDCVIKNTDGHVAYGFIPAEIADIVEAKPAPVLVTNELFDHLDVKGTRLGMVKDRGFEDIREAVTFGLQNPLAVSSGNGDGSFNVFFSKDNTTDKKNLLYANVMYSEGPVSSYIIRSISPTGNVKKGELFDRQSIPNMRIPSGFDDAALQQEIKQHRGDRVSGKTWNKGNVMKGMRMHAQEGKYPTAEEITELKQWIKDGKIDSVGKSAIGMYVTQALQQPNSYMFFQLAKEIGAFQKNAPELDAAVNAEFLATMKRADTASVEMKTSLVMALAAHDSKPLSAEYNLGNKDAAEAYVKGGDKLLNGSDEVDFLYETVKGITNNFKNPELLDTMVLMAVYTKPEQCKSADFRQKVEHCRIICKHAPELKIKQGELMKSMPRTATKEERTQAQVELENEFVQNLRGELKESVQQTNTPEKLVIDPPIDENNPRCQKHIEDRHGSDALTVGSKALPGISKEYRMGLLQTAAAAYQGLIDEQGNPGRKVFTFQAAHPMGTNALAPAENIDKNVIFSTIRDVGTPYQAKIKVALVSKEDMPKTNVVNVVMGQTGEKSANVYTMIYGDEGMPFPKEFDEKAPKEVLEFNNRCKEYWNNHVFLVTPEELKANIAELEANGQNTILQKKALREFNYNGGKSPILKSFRAPISPQAIKLSTGKLGQTQRDTSIELS